MDNCIFCKIINGEIPSTTVYEDSNYKVMMDINPANLGHLLVIPKAHCTDIFDIEEQTLSNLHALVKKIASAMKQALKPDGINIVQNNGAASGQTVLHYHVHIIPRYDNDGITMGWKGKNPTFDELSEICDKIKNVL